MTDQKNRDVTITRIFDAPRALVFKAWTDPKLVQQWWGPHFFTNPVSEVDARPGGKLLIHMRGPDGTIYPDVGVFHEVIEPERLVFISKAFEDENGNFLLEVLTTVTFEELDGKTKLTLEAVVQKASPEVEGALAGMEEGWSQSLEKLDTLFASDREFVMTRVFDAPRELVFKVCTDPSLIPQWWGPRALTTTVDRMDAQPGGEWRFVQRDADGNVYAFHGVYREITPPERLVYTFEYEGQPGHELVEFITFEAQGGKTKMTARDVFQSVEDLQGMLASGMEQGANESYDRLVELIQAVSTESRRER